LWNHRERRAHTQNQFYIVEIVMCWWIVPKFILLRAQHRCNVAPLPPKPPNLGTPQSHCGAGRSLLLTTVIGGLCNHESERTCLPAALRRTLLRCHRHGKGR
jgi:hypothetical protein